jgi:hypothetical protein
LVPDLIDRSRIEPVAQSSGVSLVFVNDVAELREASRQTVHLVIVDLDTPDALSVFSHLSGVQTVGFGSHVDRRLLSDARQAGCADVVSRSVLFHRLPTMLQAALPKP